MNPTNSSVTVSSLDIPATCSLADIFGHFADTPWAILLDSADSQHQDGRFDILVAQPLATVVTTGSDSQIWHQSNNQTEQSSSNPIDLVKQLTAQYFANCKVDSALPFIAGALGYWGYDLGKRFETLPNKNPDEYHTPDMAVGMYSWSIIKDNQQQKFYLCTVNGYSHPNIEDIQRYAETPITNSNFELNGDWSTNMTQSEYVQKLSSIDGYLKAGDCYQINLAQRFSAGYQGSEWQAYKRLRDSNSAPFSAFIRLPDSVILSISPERFLSVKQGVVQTKPIKGTRPRCAEPEEDQQQVDSLLNAEKDRAENLMIVDLLRNDLSKHCRPNSVKVPALFKLESFAAVHHLVSTVTGELDPNSSPLDLLQGAFPGGSITGAPKIRAMQIIDELEPNKRNIYCGSIGYLGINGDMDTNICIRTLLCEYNNQASTVYCWAGGGIVLDSRSEDEYQECLDKVSKILPVLRFNSSLQEVDDTRE